MNKDQTVGLNPSYICWLRFKLKVYMIFHFLPSLMLLVLQIMRLFTKYILVFNYRKDETGGLSLDNI